MCEDCGTPRSGHILTWFDGLITPPCEALFSRITPHNVVRWFETWWERLFVASGLLKPVLDFSLSEIPIRSACFVKEARKRGIPVWALKGPWGYTNHFRAQREGKIFSFEGLPNAGFVPPYQTVNIDDKAVVKKILKKRGLPVAGSKSFWFFQYSAAIKYGVCLGFPLVVKPRAGTYARHISTDIKNPTELRAALKKAFVYGPGAVIEQYVDNAHVVRITIVDYDKMAAVERVRPNVVGDGKHTIAELVAQKNADPERGEPDDETKTVYKVIVDATRVEKSRIPAAGECVYVQREPFIRLGADLKDVTTTIHPDNQKLCKDIAALFKVKLVGIDVICEDIRRSYTEQRFAILELNSLPCIEIHHYPTEGKEQSVGGYLVDLFEKYYH